MVPGQFIWEEKKYDCISTSNHTQNSTLDLKEGSKTLKLKLWKETKKKIFDFMGEKFFLNKTEMHKSFMWKTVLQLILVLKRPQ